VDFYIPGSLLVQASYSIESHDTRERELNALLKAKKKFEADTLLIITFDGEETIEVNDTKIKVIPVWKWMLQSY
jgi:predicted AAA+ superfamily ATPase